MRSFNRENFFPIKNKIKNNFLKNLLGEDLLLSEINDHFDVYDISSPSIIRKNSLLGERFIYQDAPKDAHRLILKIFV